MLQNGKTRNRWRTATWPKKVEKPKFLLQNRKTDLKDGQNRKSQRAPLQIQILGHASVDNKLVYACRRRRKKKISKWVKITDF